MGAERRRYRRIVTELDAEMVLTIGDRDGEVWPVKLVNLGPAGTLVNPGSGVRLDACVRVRFRIDNHPLALDLKGAVRWASSTQASENQEIGIQFVDLGDYDRSILYDYCYRRLQKYRRSL